tara:strand:- start:510 stop:917 length:408 start_codon:yes stop_codon:yes gene_type:complete
MKNSALNSKKLLKAVTSEESIICVLLVILVILVIYYIYQNNREGFDGDTNVLYFFYVDWCPHCKTAKPVISELEEELGDKKVRIEKVNCEENKSLPKKYGVQAYPSIILVKGEERIEYDAGVSKEGLKEFITNNL